MAKPDPRIFQLLVKRTGLVPERTLFIDDAEANVEGARRFGFAAVRFTDAEALRARLVQFGLLAPLTGEAHP